VGTAAHRRSSPRFSGHTTTQPSSIEEEGSSFLEMFMSLASIRQRDPVAAWAIARTLPLEGGLADNPQDPGGVTAFGVSLRYALAAVKMTPRAARFFDIDRDGDVDRADIAGLTADAAADIYDELWWRPGWYGRLTPARVAWKAFDIAVNTGPKRAAILLQSALCRIGSSMPIDGDVGPITIDAVQAQARADDGEALMGSLRAEQAGFYRRLAAHAPKLKPFLAGWLNRAAA
jgi:lysozyme family protein